MSPMRVILSADGSIVSGFLVARKKHSDQETGFKTDGIEKAMSSYECIDGNNGIDSLPCCQWEYEEYSHCISF